MASRCLSGSIGAGIGRPKVGDQDFVSPMFPAAGPRIYRPLQDNCKAFDEEAGLPRSLLDPWHPTFESRACNEVALPLMRRAQDPGVPLSVPTALAPAV